ncbi:dihydrolipoamide dehydrogenase [Nonlabens arenilitoris]|uniref:Dihydrolipoamide dehydrogenase n=1 Tax=Nonlabens arenilitoris TaxID=1217969 RepID=A0A2S7UCP5_9FLAO|nr:DUF2911 domain-containing protein [Nonlabens arenilitoris]PQJ32718.1 dihydrolipoamide dehydrogenase [Nonlabens arenilitoris]
MKYTLLAFMSLFVATTLTAQIEAPQPSPSAMVKQTVGLTEVTLEYSRPAMRDRDIFGDLVPFDKMWRTGANANSTVSFSDDVMVAGKELKAGTYAVFTKPSKKEWEVYFYTDHSNWGTPREWDESKVAAMVKVPVSTLKNTQESFTMAINEINMEGAHLQIMWANTMVAVPFSVPTKAKTEASIDKVMAGPSANDYYSAASFYLDADKDLKKAQEWITKATELSPKAFWMFRKKSLIEAKLGNTSAAIASAKQSLALATAAGNADYVKMNKDSLKEWGVKM